MRVLPCVLVAAISIASAAQAQQVFLQGANLTEAQKASVQSAAEFMKELGQTTNNSSYVQAGERTLAKSEPCENNPGGDYTTWNFSLTPPYGLLETRGDRMEDGKDVYEGKSDRNEVTIEADTFLPDGQYVPTGLTTQSSLDAQIAVLASGLYHEYQHCVQTTRSGEPDGSPEDLAIWCRNAAAHKDMLEKQFTFLVEALNWLKNQGLLTEEIQFSVAAYTKGVLLPDLTKTGEDILLCNQHR